MFELGEPLAELDVSDVSRFSDQSIYSLFAFLRSYQPVHFCESSPHGPYWSISRFSDIASIEADPKRFSSRSGFTLTDIDSDFKHRSILSSDGQDHLRQRRTIAPLMTMEGINALEVTIKKAAIEILDAVPLDKPFDWVERVSIALTGRMLATMMGAPHSDFQKLIHWSHIASIVPGANTDLKSFEEKDHLLEDCYRYFLARREISAASPLSLNFVSLLAHMKPEMEINEYLSTIIILIVGGNETTRNSISASVLFFDQFPDQRDLFYTHPELMGSGISEIIRYQTPLMYMRRTATEDVEIGRKTIKKGDKVIMWYLSGNRDEEAISYPDEFIINRTRSGRHLSFGFGPHRCIGRRLAEMQIRVLWQEIIRRKWIIQPTGNTERTVSNFINGFNKLEVIIRN
jgi:cytochrome P450